MPPLRTLASVARSSPLAARSGSPHFGSPLTLPTLTRASSPGLSSLDQETRPIPDTPPHEQGASSPHKSPVGANISAKLAAFQVAEGSPVATSTPEPREAPVSPRGAKIGAKLAALTAIEKAATDAPKLTHSGNKWKPRNDVFGSYARKQSFDKNATGLPPARSLTDLP